MKHLSFHRKEGARRLYIQGDLQFDERDERLYHEPLALLPVALAVSREKETPLRVLILGGGDGLAVREVLKFPHVQEVVVIDKDPVVVNWAKTRWSDLNQNALSNPKVRVLHTDVRTMPIFENPFHVIVMDLTYPKDLESMEVFSTSFFSGLREKLSSRGILAVNAVSPEMSPAAFGCIARTLEASGFHVLPYAPDIPSFRAEGYGRWGFVFSSREALSTDEVLEVVLPAGHNLSSETRRSSLLWPETTAFEACPNWTQELLVYISQAKPIRWEAPWGAPSFGKGATLTVLALTVSQGFTTWLKGDEGSRTLNDVMAALPLEHQGLIQERFEEEKESLETWLRQMDWKAFLDKALEREKEWPAVWREELRAWRTQWQNVSTHVETIFKQSYRVLAILLIALLLANLLYPDNLYAKGFSSHHGGGDGISFTSMRSASPYRSHYRNAHWDRSRLFDQSGREYPRLLFTRPGQLVLTPLALSATLQLLEDASVAYATPVHGVVGHLTPGEFSLRTTRGEVLMNFGLDPFLQTDILKQVQSQQPVIKKARADHERWQEWIQWAKWTGPGRDASDDRVTLDRWSRLLDEAGEKWRVPTLAVTSAVPGIMLIPGIYVDVTAGTQAILILQKEGRFIHRPIPLPSSQNPFDLFLMNVLSQAASKPGGHDIQRYLPPPSSSRTQSW